MITVVSPFTVLFIPIALLGIICVYAIRKQFRLSDRTPDEVTIFIQKIDWDELESLFDKVLEIKAVIFNPGYSRPRTTRVRIYTAREFFGRMHENICIIQEWINTEIDDLVYEFEDRRAQRREQLTEASDLVVGLRASLIIQICKLSIWTVLRVDKWPVRHLPSVASLRKCGDDYDIIENYKRLREVAADIALRYGQRFHDELHAAF